MRNLGVFLQTTLAASVVLLTTACGDCKVPCASTPLVVDLPSGMEPGSWSFEMDVDGNKRFTCDAILPPSQDVHPNCTDSEVELHLRPKAGTGSPGRFEFAVTPTQLHITVRHEGQLTTEETIVPSYKERYSNNPECGLSAMCAKERLSIGPAGS